jgi:secondary thiamine-phosphate synthase enzyme
MQRLALETKKRNEFLDITGAVQGMVNAHSGRCNACVVYCPHTTAGLTVNEHADPAVREDLIAAFSRLVPADAGYAHAEGNSDSHAKAALCGSSVTVLVKEKKLLLGTWQGIFFCEFDGPRTREVWVQFL